MTVLSDRPATLAPVPEGEPVSTSHRIAIGAFVVVPFLAVLAAVPLLWNHGLGWSDVLIAVVMYGISGHGVTVGFHRMLTHGSFKARRPVRVALAVAGSLAVEGGVIQWVADHRRHHAFSDQPNDPHSPHRYGDSVGALMKGLFHAHVGWLFYTDQSSPERYAPDLLADPDMVRVDRAFRWLVVVSLLVPPLAGFALTGTLAGAATAFFWGSLVRIFVLHHATWSVNSLCHTFGDRPYKTRDRSTNFWPLALLSMGECWHNLHHAEPTSARHGVDRGQIDSSAVIIRLMERLGWVSDVRWPDPGRLAARRG